MATLLLFAACGDPAAKNGFHTDGRTGCGELVRASLETAHGAREVQSYETSRFFSSAAATNKVMLSSYAPHVTGDMDHGFFLNVRDTTNEVEATLAECTGPGFVAWMWSANPLGEVWIYVDATNAPVLRKPFDQFMNAQLPGLRAPFAGATAGGFNLHVPIVHSNYCRIEVHAPSRADLGTLYYQVAWNALPSNAPLATFTKDTFGEAAAALRQQARVARARMSESAGSAPRELIIPAGGTAILWTTAQAATVTNIAITAERRQDLANLLLSASWDASTNHAIESPLLLLAGGSSHGEEMEHLLARTTTHGVTLRWHMPCEKGQLELTNTQRESVHLSVGVDAKLGVGSTLRLHASRTRRLRLPLTKRNDVSLARIEGAGRIAACFFQVESRTDQWWGEGDVIVRLDGNDATPWHSPGTEDYIGFANCSTKTFEHPFRGQSLVRFSNAGRTTALHRLHVLDELPFHRSADLAMEVTGLGSGDADLDALVLYYLRTRPEPVTGPTPP